MGPQYEFPTAYIIHSEESRSRTIINYRDLPGISFGLFQQIFADNSFSFDWVHCEGNYIEEMESIILWIQKSHSIKISVEIEKPNRTNIEKLIPLADVLFFSNDYMKSKGYASSEHFLESMSTITKKG